MNFRQIECFLHIADAASFSRAAVVLGVTQPALSRQIKELEADLGAPLFYRNGRGALLTEQGRAFYGRARELLDGMRLARAEVASFGAEGAHQCVIAVAPTIARFLSAVVLKTLAAHVPNVRVRLVEALSSHILEWLANGRIDLAIVYDTSAASAFETEPVIDERLNLIGPADAFARGGTVAFDGLADYPLIMPGDPHGARRLVDGLATRRGVTLRHVIEADSLGAIVDLVRNRMGYGLLPLAPLKAELDAAHISAAAVVDPEIRRSIVLVVARNRPPVRGVNDVVRAIKRMFAQLERLD